MTTMIAPTELLSLPTLDWDLAACRGDANPDQWFPDPKQSFAYAAGVCESCPMIAACARYAADNKLSGVWGGREFRNGRIAR